MQWMHFVCLGRCLNVFMVDAALPFDYEHRQQEALVNHNRMKVGIVGFGTFGQFLAKRLVTAGFQVIQ